MKMFRFLKLFNGSQRVFSPVLRIFPSIKNDANLFLLRFSSSIEYSNLKSDKKTDSSVQDKVILYKCNNDHYYKKMRLFSLCNFIIWSLFGISTYDSLSKEPKMFDDKLKQEWKDSERKRKFTQRLIIASIILGFFLVLAIWFHFLRSVKQIELMKKTKVVTFKTYSFFPSVREFDVPLNNVSGVIGRHTAKGQIPLKVKNSLFYFMVDVRGEFPDTFLFDNTVGVKRDLSRSKK